MSWNVVHLCASSSIFGLNRPGYGLTQVNAEVDGVPFARKPHVVDLEALRTVAVEPVVVSVPFHTWLTFWPPASGHWHFKILSSFQVPRLPYSLADGWLAGSDRGSRDLANRFAT